MFVRTERLTLRPGWAEDAPALVEAIGHEAVVRNLSRVPWPYGIEAAETFVASFGNVAEPKFLIFEHRGESPRLIGCVGVSRTDDDAPELGYWLTPAAWGRGFATEAGAAALRAARAAGIRRVTARHAVDNPASGKVLRKLGFCPTGKVAYYFSKGRGTEVSCVCFEIDLGEPDCNGVDPDARMAA